MSTEVNCIGSVLLETFKMQTATEYVSQRFFESFSEFSIEISIDDWIHGRIEVAHPEQYVH